MSDTDETVLEVKASGEFTFHLPIDSDSPHQTIVDLASEVDEIRHVDGLTIDQAYKMQRY